MSRKYRHHKYTWSKPFGSVSHVWTFLGPVGGISFHVSLTENYSASCVLEYHHTEAAGYRIDEAPDHIDCPVTGGRCWHDGTSLYASETVWPYVESYLRQGNHEAIFRYLEGEASNRFDGLTARRGLEGAI